ncbi:N-acetylglucosamine kinase [Krasilnikoviella flava]|uniref:BadF-type ATPase n=1 Tax=Krasilnikoviella flava TaxID=526729 RepID=A0A1T5KPU3_9MICO|nr:BadF/BadG/BcrA/BcrD ATPase family protein [Krasilnikoviella flava]SKC65683.1 BadF-type ATPase [Krasilnikoviella flava]
MTGPDAPTAAPEHVVAVDVGGSGARLVAVPRHRPPAADPDGAPGPAGAMTLSGRPVRITTAGSDAADVVAELVDTLTRQRPGLRLAAAAVSVTGLPSLVPEPGALHDVLHDAGAGATAVAADALAAHLGALGGRPGAVAAVGTGAIVLATDLRRRWHRADGWGHLLGDLGSGSWIGAHGLRAAIATHDGRPGPASPTLLAAALERFGPVDGWPAALYGRPDRAHVLASFTPAVADAARAGDLVATRLLHDAGTHLAESIAAALRPGIPPLAAVTGGVLQIGAPVTTPLEARLSALRPDVRLVPADGSPLDGALRLARSLLDERPGDGALVEPHDTWLTVRRTAGPAGTIPASTAPSTAGAPAGKETRA